MMVRIILFYCILFFTSCSVKKTEHTSLSGSALSLFKEKTINIVSTIDMQGKLIKLNNQKIIFSENGFLKNGTLYCNNCEIVSQPKKIFDHFSFSGDWSGNDGYIEWFLGSALTNAKLNFLAIENLLKNQFIIYLQTKVPVETSSETSFSNPGPNLIFKGKSPEKSGLILKTKHKNLFYSYFRSDKGFNLVFKNLSLITEDFQKGIQSDQESEYFFSGSYYQDQFNPGAKPSIDSLVIENCFIGGNIAVSYYGAHSKNQTVGEFTSSSKIDKIVLKNNRFDQCNSPFAFSNMGYRDILIENNVVTNFSSSFISIPESGLEESYYEGLRKNKGIIRILGNTFKNDRVVKVPSDRILSPCVIKGGYGSMEFHGNKLENLLSNSKDADVHTFYFTSQAPGYFSVKDNIIINVTGRGSVTHPASVIKHRWSDKLNMENNIVKIEKSALVKIGAIKSIQDDLSNLTGNQFYCDFFQIGGQKDFTKIFHVKNNTFVFPIMNKSTEIYDIADFRFENNNIIIEYFGPSMIQSSVSLDNSFFLGRQRLDRKISESAGDFISSGNSISIGKTGNGILKYIDFPDGVQINQNDIPDKNYNYKKVLINDTFNLTNTGVEVILPDAEIHVYKPIIYGKENAFYLHDFANANHLRPNGKSIESDVTIDHAVWKRDKSPFVFLPGSKQKLTVNKHSGDKIQVLNYIYFQSLFNMAKEEDLTLKLSFSAKDKKGKQFQSEYYFHLHQKGRTILFETENGSFEEVFPADASGINLAISPEVILKSDIKSKPVLVLERGDKHLKEATFVLKNCEEIENYIITCNVFKSGFQKADRKSHKAFIQKLKKE